MIIGCDHIKATNFSPDRNNSISSILNNFQVKGIIILSFFSLHFYKAAQNAQKESVDLFQSIFFQDLPEDDDRRICDAVIFSLRANGVLVFVPR